MTEEQINDACVVVGNGLGELYSGFCTRAPKAIVIIGLTGGLAACATEAGISRDKMIAALNSAFDDIEARG